MNQMQGTMSTRPAVAFGRSTGAVSTPIAPSPTARVAQPMVFRCRYPERQGRGSVGSLSSVAEPETATLGSVDEDQRMRCGSGEAKLLMRQAAKSEPEQESIANIIPAYEPVSSSSVADAVVVGCGPAGLALAAELGERGVEVVLLGMESKFTNNYGVWKDEFDKLGLAHTMDQHYDDAVCYFGLEDKDKVNVGRAYGRVARTSLRSHLLKRCKDAGVKFMAGEVTEIDAAMDSVSGRLICRNGTEIRSRLITLASGAVAGKFLKFEDNAPPVAAQTAYGIEAVVKGYGDVFDESTMLFMDYRRHHTGLYDGQALAVIKDAHPLGADGLWGTDDEVPSFLYAMPLKNGRVFLEETALVARPELPFQVLKRRLDRRLQALGIEVVKVEDEEWSYIPVGGPLPIREQPVTAFGAAANMVHPATGYSLARSMREAPELAAGIAKALKDEAATVGQLSGEVWDVLWNAEKQRQAAFHVFGMELLAKLSPKSMNEFFQAFFGMPSYYWQNFLGASLSSGELLVFAGIFFVKASNGIRLALMSHLFGNDSAMYMINKYIDPVKRALSSKVDQ